MPAELILTAPRELQFQPYTDGPLKPDEVRAKAILSGISHGTEMNLYTGNNPFVDREFDPELRLFVPRKAMPEMIKPGYEWVGRVTEIGSQVTKFKVGDVIHLANHHRETHTFRENETTMIGEIFPLDMQPEQAVVLALAGVALQAVHDAHLKVGDHVVVFGLGVIGLLTVQLARLNGAGWVDAVDPIAKRRALALLYGADRVFDPSEVDVAYQIKSSSPQRGADVAIETSGNYTALNEAIRLVRVAGTVIAAGFYRGGGTALQLGAEWHHNRVTMVSSMGVWDCPHRDYPLWTRGRVHEVSAQLLASGKLRTDGLITHRIPFTEVPSAYQLIEEKPEEVIKVVLAY